MKGVLSGTGYFLISGSYPKDSWYFYNKEGQSLPALSHLPQVQLTVYCQQFPHQWNFQNSRGKRRRKYKAQCMSPQKFIKTSYTSKLVTIIPINHTAFTHSPAPQGEGDRTGLSKRRTNFHFAPFTWLWRSNFQKFNNELFTWKSLSWQTTRNNLFFQEILLAKKPKLQQDGDDSESTTFVLRESSIIIHLGHPVVT